MPFHLPQMADARIRALRRQAAAITAAGLQPQLDPDETAGQKAEQARQITAASQLLPRELTDLPQVQGRTLMGAEGPVVFPPPDEPSALERLAAAGKSLAGLGPRPVQRRDEAPSGLERLRTVGRIAPPPVSPIEPAEAERVAVRGPGVYEVEGQPGMVDVVLDGSVSRMSEDEAYGGPNAANLLAAVRASREAPQERALARRFSETPASEQARGLTTTSADGETVVFAPSEEPGVYDVPEAPGMVEVVGLGSAAVMPRAEYEADAGLQAAVADAQRIARAERNESALPASEPGPEIAAGPIAMPVEGRPDLVDVVDGTTVRRMRTVDAFPTSGVSAGLEGLPIEAETEPAQAVAATAPSGQVGPRQQRRAEPARPLTKDEGAEILAGLRGLRPATAALAAGPVLAREGPSQVADGRGGGAPSNGVASQVAQLIPGAALAQDATSVTLTPEAFQALMTLTGDEQLQALGEQVGGRARERRQMSARAEERGEARRLEERRLGLQERELTERREDRRSAAAARAADRRLARDQLNDAKEARTAAKAATDAARYDAALERDVQRLGKDTEGTAKLVEDMKYLESLATSPGEIPGFGLWDSIKPGVAQDAPDIQARQAAMRVASELLRQISGAAVTPSEAQRFMEGRGIGPGYTEAQAKSGIQGMVRDLRAEMKAKTAKYRPEVVERLRARGGTLPESLSNGKAPATSPGVAPARAAEPAAPAPGEVFMRNLDTGETGWMDAAEVADAEADGWERA